jgi:hypothetical protein
MFADEALAQRLALQNKEFFSALVPAVREAGLGEGEPLLDLGDSMAFFAGEGSPLTQAIGALTAEHLQAIQTFYRGRATTWEAVLTPFSGPEALQRVIDLGGKAMGWESVLYRQTSDPLPDWQPAPEITVVEVDQRDLALWIDVSTTGFFRDEADEVGVTLGRILAKARNIRRYLGLWNGEPAGAASLTPGCGIGFLGGMSTLSPYRGRGIQTALLRRRLEDTKAEADLAIIGARQGTSSHRNAERLGFRIAYPQLSFQVPVD